MPMQSLVTTDYYKTEHTYNFSGSDDDLEKLLNAAYIIVDNAVCGRLSDIERYPSAVQEKAKLAICLETDYLISNGGTDFLFESGFSSVSIGSFSYSMNSSGDKADNTSGKIAICDMAVAVLQHTGLLYRGVDIL